MLIKDNKAAFMVNHIIIAAGMILVGIGTFLFDHRLIDAPLWMVLIGTGLYMGYIPFNSIFFDRLIATFQYVGTVGFIMYVADAFGYVGSVGVLFFKEFSGAELSYLDLFITGGYALSVIGMVLIVSSMVYFHVKDRRANRESSVMSRE